MTAVNDELHERARELEQESARVRDELDGIYATLAEDDEDDSFMARMADRFRDERDQARREVAGLKSQLASRDSEVEARFRAVEARFYTMRSALHSVVNNPLTSRDHVQSVLLQVLDKVRNFEP